MCGCLAENPAYNAATGGASATGTTGATTTTGASSGAGTTADPTTGAITGTTGGIGVSASDSTTGTTTEATTGTTLETTTGSTTGEPETTGAPMPEVVRHYDPARCLEPLWCFSSPDVWAGIPGQMRGAECFDAPLAPPFRVRRIDYTIVATRFNPSVRFQVRSADLSQVLYSSDPLWLPNGPGSLQIPPELQPVIGEARFCVSFVGGDGGSAIGIGADKSVLPGPQQSFYGSDACGEPGLRDVNLFVPEIVPHGPWCLGAEIAGL